MVTGTDLGAHVQLRAQVPDSTRADPREVIHRYKGIYRGKLLHYANWSAHMQTHFPPPHTCADTHASVNSIVTCTNAAIYDEFTSL
jgi:hypothetical protein